jgi:NAD(P)-dependent dehydrogenase (short-subunit alcohol dehydrogenase family)
MTQSTESLLSMQGKVALVTGASSGLGAHFARVIASAGGRVIASARRRERLEALVSEIVSAGGEAIAVSLDVTSEHSMQAALAEAESSLGPVDVLVNNAGVADSRHCLKVDEDSWDFIMDTNLKAAWRLARELSARAVAANRPCTIVNIASILGLRVGFGESTYGAAKAGLIQLTRAMAMELGRKGIRVNALCPGYFVTELNSDYLLSEAGREYLARIPAGRHGELEELTVPLLLLASDAGSYINGSTLAVDGGHLVTSL